MKYSNFLKNKLQFYANEGQCFLYNYHLNYSF